MAFPLFSWIPHQAKSVFPTRQYIQLNEGLSDLQITPQRDVTDTYAIGGGVSRSMTRSWVNVRIVLDRFNNRQLHRQFANLINHLERGGTVALSSDGAKMFAGRVTAGGMSVGSAGVSFDKNLTRDWAKSEKIDYLAVGDEIVIENQPPFAAREAYKIETVSEFDEGRGRYGLDLTSTHSHREGAIVRYHDFFPVLVLPKSQVNAGNLSHDHRITSTLDINLTYIVPYDNEKSVPQGAL